QKLEELKKELRELNDKYKSIIEQDYNHNTIAQQLKHNRPLQIMQKVIELKLDYLLKTICEENIEKAIAQLEVEYKEEITIYTIYQYESLNYWNNIANYVQSRYYQAQDSAILKEAIRQYENSLFRVYKEITRKEFLLMTLEKQELQHIYWKLNAKECTCTYLENILFNYLTGNKFDNENLTHLVTVQITNDQLKKEYQIFEYLEKVKEVLQEIPLKRNYIQRTIQDLLARTNPTNDLKLEATLKLLDASVQTAALITFSQTTYWKKFLYNLERLEKESKIPFRILRILQTTFVSVQLLLQTQGVTPSTYELHKSIITTEQRLQQAHLLNRAHTICKEIETAKRIEHTIINNPRYYRSTDEDYTDQIEHLTPEEKYIYQEIFFRNIEHEDLYEEYRNHIKRKEPKIREISTQYDLNDLKQSNLYYTSTKSGNKPIYISRRNN
ncbi:35261_t:CDS:2, partial [Racocetra persica]